MSQDNYSEVPARVDRADAVVEHVPAEDDVTQLAKRVSKARRRLVYQFDPALTEALSEDELQAERELAERIREQEREQRWKQAQALASASDRARHTTEQIEKADIRDLLLARRAIAAQRRESSPHAKLASLYRHRSWSLRALAGVVAAGMLWSAVNVQHNIAPGGPGDPLYWFSYLLEGMISVCLVIIMTGTNKVAEWGVVDNRRQVATAEVALLAVTVTLNTYPYLSAAHWYDAGVHAVAPVMIGVALLIHDAASVRYGLAIGRATDQVRDLPDPAEQIRRTFPPSGAVRLAASPELPAGTDAEYAEESAALEASKADTGGISTPDVDTARATGVQSPADSNGYNVGEDAVPTTELSGLDALVTSDSQIDSNSRDPGDGYSARSTKSSRDVGVAARVDEALQSVYDPSLTDTGQLRVAEVLEQELAELQANRRKARAGKSA